MKVNDQRKEQFSDISLNCANFSKNLYYLELFQASHLITRENPSDDT